MHISISPDFIHLATGLVIALTWLIEAVNRRRRRR